MIPPDTLTRRRGQDGRRRLLFLIVKPACLRDDNIDCVKRMWPTPLLLRITRRKSTAR